jgi:hypothetical protein
MQLRIEDYDRNQVIENLRILARAYPTAPKFADEVVSLYIARQ